jgi:hypothetical protein
MEHIVQHGHLRRKQLELLTLRGTGCGDEALTHVASLSQLCRLELKPLQTLG